MTLRPEQIETLLAALRTRTPPAPLSKPSRPEQQQYVLEQLPAAFAAIGIETVSDQALAAVLRSDRHLHAIRERALYPQPTDLFSMKFFRFRDQMPALHATLVRLFTDAAGTGQTKLRIWNPACGYGADTYAIAALTLLARSATGTEATAIEVIGTDVLPQALRQATQGDYTYDRPTWQAHRDLLVRLFDDEAIDEDEARLPVSTQHLPEGVAHMFSVTKQSTSRYTIRPRDALRRLVSFRPVNPLDIAALGQLGRFDLVVCAAALSRQEAPTGDQFRQACAHGVRAGGFLVLPPNAPPLPTKPDRPETMEQREQGLYCRLK